MLNNFLWRVYEPIYRNIYFAKRYTHYRYSSLCYREPNAPGSEMTRKRGT
jgi:hypothetical protein